MTALVKISVNQNSGLEMYSLREWLNLEKNLRGRVRLQERHRTGNEHLGGVAEVLIVTLGTGGAGAILASSLNSWINSRRSNIRITIETKQEKIEIDAQNVKDSLPILHELFHAHE